jgi:hypothetical protein
MNIVSKNQLVRFIEAYTKRMDELISKYPFIDRTLIFPDYILTPHLIHAYISKKHGVAIEFTERSQKNEVIVKEVAEKIEDAVLPKVADVDRGFFVVRGGSTVLETINLITEDFYKINKEIFEVFSKAANLVMDDLGWFLKVENGDIKLINVGIGCVIKGKNIIKNVKFLWIIGTNEPSFFSAEVAERHASEDFKRYLSKLIPRTPISLLISTLQHYLDLIHNKNVNEDDIHKFLALNP